VKVVRSTISEVLTKPQPVAESAKTARSSTDKTKGGRTSGKDRSDSK